MRILLEKNSVGKTWEKEPVHHGYTGRVGEARSQSTGLGDNRRR